MKAELKPQFIELRAKGLSLAKIAEQIGVSKTTLIAWQKEMSKEISEAQFLDMQSLLDEFKLCKAERMKHLGKLYQRLTEELAQKDFSEVEPVKLLEMLSKVEGRLESELREVKLTISEGIDVFGKKELSLWSESDA